MLSWLVRLILIVAGILAEFFVARDAINFSIIQGVMALLIFGVIVIALAFWPVRWSDFLNRRSQNASK